METKTKIINGVSFEISQPYAEGQTINAAEAKALNQVRSENIGNNVRQKVQELIEAGKTDEAKALVAEKDASYVFTLASVGTPKVVDPVEKEARSLAKELLKAALAEKGLKITVTPEGETDESWAEKMENNLQKLASRDDILAEAKKTVDAKKKRFDKLSANIEV